MNTLIRTANAAHCSAQSAAPPQSPITNRQSAICFQSAILVALACFALCVSSLAAPSPTVIPFQGRLTNPQGVVYTNGQYTIVFNLYDQAVGGSQLWSETHQKVGVINGMINVFLGSINPITNVDFSQTRHLGITIDIDGNPNTPDPEMVPRQMIIPAFWAKNSEKLAGQDWTPVFGVNSPVGPLPGGKIQNQSITASQIANNTITSQQLAGAIITSNQILAGSISSLNLAPGSVLTSNIADGAVVLTKLAPRQIGTNAAGLGGIAFSQSSGQASFSVSTSSETAVPNLSLTLVTTGRPVLVFLSSVAPAPPVTDTDYGVSYIQVASTGLNASLNFNIYRSTALISRNQIQWGAGSPGFGAPFDISVPPSCIQFIDSPPAGTNSYSVTLSGISRSLGILLYNIRLVALEL